MVKGKFELKSDFYKNVLEFYKACFFALNIFCNFSRSLFIIEKIRKTRSELKSNFYKNILEFSKATFLFKVNFCHYAGSTQIPITD